MRGKAQSALGWDEWEKGRAVIPFGHGAHSHQLIVPADGFRDVGLRHPHSLQREINTAPDGEVGVQKNQLPRVLGLPAQIGHALEEGLCLPGGGGGVGGCPTRVVLTWMTSPGAMEVRSCCRASLRFSSI